MSNYTRSTNFTAKDALASGNPSKIVLGSEHDTEYSAIATAIATKLDSIETLSAETVLASGDSIPLYDASATSNKRITVANARVALASWADTGFFMQSTTTTSCGDGVYTRITLAEQRDEGNNVTGSYYTIPTTGTYLFWGGISLAITNPIVSTVAAAIQFTNASDVTLGSYNLDLQITPAATSTPGPCGISAVNLVAGNRVYLACFHNNGGARTASSGGACFLGGWRLGT